MNDTVIIKDCLRLALRGGPEVEKNRGMTLGLSTGYIDQLLHGLSNFDLILESQESLTQRSLVVYGEKSNGYIQDLKLLERLKEIKKGTSSDCSKMQTALLMINELVEFK